MLYSSLVIQNNQNHVISNLLLSKNNIYNVYSFPKLQKITIYFFFKSKKQAINVKNSLFLVGFFNFYLKLKKNQSKILCYSALTKSHKMFSFFYFFLILREILKLSKIYSTKNISCLTFQSMAPIFALLDVKFLRENLSKNFKFRITFHFTHKNTLFVKQFLNAIF